MMSYAEMYNTNTYKTCIHRKRLICFSIAAVAWRE